MKKTAAFLLFAAPTILASSAHAVEADKNGCWDAPQHCVSMDIRKRGSNLVAAVQNKCSGRLYIQACFERTKGEDDCYSDGVSAGDTKNFSPFGAQDKTGRVRLSFVGATRSGSDWVCKNW